MREYDKNPNDYQLTENKIALMSEDFDADNLEFWV